MLSTHLHTNTEPSGGGLRWNTVEIQATTGAKALRFLKFLNHLGKHIRLSGTFLRPHCKQYTSMVVSIVGYEVSK